MAWVNIDGNLLHYLDFKKKTFKCYECILEHDTISGKGTLEPHDIS